MRCRVKLLAAIIASPHLRPPSMPRPPAMLAHSNAYLPKPRHVDFRAAMLRVDASYWRRLRLLFRMFHQRSTSQVLDAYARQFPITFLYYRLPTMENTPGRARPVAHGMPRFGVINRFSRVALCT